MFCSSGRFVPPNTFPLTFFLLWTFFSPDGLSLNVRLPDVLSLDVLSGHHNKWIVMRKFYAGE
jgi:hypothetical protein